MAFRRLKIVMIDPSLLYIDGILWLPCLLLLGDICKMATLLEMELIGFSRVVCDWSRMWHDHDGGGYTYFGVHWHYTHDLQTTTRVKPLAWTLCIHVDKSLGFNVCRFDSSYFVAVPECTKEYGGNYTGCAMNSVVVVTGALEMVEHGGYAVQFLNRMATTPPIAGWNCAGRIMRDIIQWWQLQLFDQPYICSTNDKP